MLNKSLLKKIIQNDWMIALFLLVIFLLSNGYIYGWDDQHLEIPLLKKLIDAQLYPNDYYVDTLQQNFTSYFYVVLSKLITINQIPAVYLVLYLISRFFLFLGIYKIWKFISKRKDIGFYCASTLILLGRVDEFLYRTFSHQEFALAIIIFGLYFFYRERFILASVLLGVAANFHAVYSLFPMTYVGLYLLIFIRRHGFKNFFGSCGAYLFTALPVIIWIFQKIQQTKIPAGHPALDDWYFLYTLSCPQNFLFNVTMPKEMLANVGVFLKATERYFLLLGMYLFNVIFHEKFRKDRKIQTITVTVFLMLLVSFIFTYMKPSRFVLDLNLIRNLQFLLFFYVGYTTLLIVRSTEEQPLIPAALFGIGFITLRFMDYSGICALALIGSIFFFMRALNSVDKRGKMINVILMAALFLSAAYGLYLTFRTGNYGANSMKVFYGSIILIAVATIFSFLHKSSLTQSIVRKLFVIIPLVLILISYGIFHYRYLQIKESADGFWQLQRNWIDMQKYVRDNTPKNAYLLVPHDTEMGGFRIHSERPIICSYRDCGVVGFDYKAAVEWYKRINDIWSFKVFVGRNSPQPMSVALVRAMKDYKVNYVVFMNYAAPAEKTDVLERIYQNEVFVLYKVTVNPVLPMFSGENG